MLYGQRDEPYTVITQLSQRLEGTLAPDAVLPTIVEMVDQALKLPYAAILLKQEDTLQLSASAGKLAGDPLVLPLVYQKDTIGRMQLAPRAPGEPFTPADRRLLEISYTVASTLQLQPLLGLILDQLKLVIETTGSSILTLDGGKTWCSLTAGTPSRKSA